MALQALPHAGRSQVFTALFNLLKMAPSPTQVPYKTFTQRMQIWDAVPPGDQPCLILERGPQFAEQVHAYGVTKWKWKVLVWIYYQVGGFQTANTYPDMLTDQFLDGLEQLFLPPGLNSKFTLGGLVQNCWIDGMIACEPGLVDGQGLIVVPVSIVL